MGATRCKVVLMECSDKGDGNSLYLPIRRHGVISSRLAQRVATGEKPLCTVTTVSSAYQEARNSLQSYATVPEVVGPASSDRHRVEGGEAYGVLRSSETNPIALWSSTSGISAIYCFEKLEARFLSSGDEAKSAVIWCIATCKQTAVDAVYQTKHAKTCLFQAYLRE
jgi:hypothetical protein